MVAVKIGNAFSFAQYENRARLFSLLEIIIIVVLACIPLFVSFPYRVNIFLSWEGAYRLSEGHMPYRDFGMPMGYMYWVVPAVFFKLFGPLMITLVKAQVFINIISGLAFRSILKSLGVQRGIGLLGVLLYCLSYSFFNFWPWYNHTVIVYQMAGLAFLLKYIFSAAHKWRWIWLPLAAFFVFCSFFTKQDAGALAILLAIALLTCHCIYEKRWTGFVVFIACLAVIGTLFIYPLLQYNFGYWFNHGQEPHTARLSLSEIINDFFSASEWIKFYLFFTVLLVMASIKNEGAWIKQKRNGIFLLLTLGILAEAAVLQVTSYTPPDNNIFFHSFGFVFLLSGLVPFLNLDFSNLKPVVIALLGLLLWWSGTYWQYMERFVNRAMPSAKGTNSTENIVNRNTYKISTINKGLSMSRWVFSGLPSFKEMYMPAPTVQGIQRLMNLEAFKGKQNLHVLNMTELTPLATEMNFRLDKGLDQPLWYHLGVAMFNRQAAMFEQRIGRKEYDLVLFEYIPSLNNFYPFRVRDSLQVHYQKIDSFMAPRRGETQGQIEVYTR